MTLAAQIVGLFAVALFLLSYQQKKRKNIIVCNATSRVLYILQYLMLGAFEGAVLDVLGTVSSVLAEKKDKGFVNKHQKLVFVLINLAMVGAGIILAKNLFSYCALAGVMLHTMHFGLPTRKPSGEFPF